MNADSLLHWLMRTSLEASVLILAILGLRWLLGARLSPAWRIGLWMLVGAKLMLPAFVPAGFGLGAWMQQQKSPSAIALPGIPAEPTQTAIVALRAVNLPDGSSTTTFSFSPKAALVGLWFTVAAGILLLAFTRQRRFDQKLRSRRPATAPHLITFVARLAQRANVRKPVQTILMPPGTAPAMVGIRQPKLLLPEDWETRFDDRSLRHVVLHELFHVKRGDLTWNWIALAVQALHWFNPLVWFVVSRFQADRELRCDAGALALLSPTERLHYGHTLLRIQETFFAPPAIAGLAPCVRNHPTLRQRIHMIAHPAARQPVLQLLLVLTLSALVCYSFTTARAAEKEVPAKERTREGARTPSAEQPKSSTTEAGTPARPSESEGGGTQKPATREREGSSQKSGMRDGDGGAKKPGTGDGESTRKTGARDGEKPRTGEREGDSARKTGARDGEGGARKPGTGDGEGTRKTGARDGEKPRTGEREVDKKTGSREGEGSKKTGARDGDKNTTTSSETITLKVIKNGEAVLVGDEEVTMRGLRGHLSSFLPDHPGAKVIVTGDDNIPLGSLHNTVDAVRDNGNKNVSIKSE